MALWPEKLMKLWPPVVVGLRRVRPVVEVRRRPAVGVPDARAQERVRHLVVPGSAAA